MLELSAIRMHTACKYYRPTMAQQQPLLACVAGAIHLIHVLRRFRRLKYCSDTTQHQSCNLT